MANQTMKLRCKRCRRTMGCGKWWDRAEVRWSDRIEDVCAECEFTVNVTETMRRVEAWAAKHGTRRRMAELMVRDADRAEGVEYQQAFHRGWIFVWENTGCRKALRKVIERRIMRLHDDQLVYSDPDVAPVPRAEEAA
jgi:hypothetical protein